MKKRILFLLFTISCISLTHSQWDQIGQDIDGEAAGDRSSLVSLSADGNIMAIGAAGNDGNGNISGHVRVYENNNGIWTQIGVDIEGGIGDQLGQSVSLSTDGGIVAIGAPYDSSNGFNSGYVGVYENIGGDWTQIGDNIYGDANGDRFGLSVTLSSDGNIIATGAYYNDNSNGNDPGHVRVYENNNGIWTQIGADIEGVLSGSDSGFPKVSLSANGSILAIGAQMYSGSGSDPGNVRIYENVAGVWTQIGADLVGEGPGDWSGVSVNLSADGGIVAIGSIYNLDSNGDATGHVRIYENLAGVWTQIGADIDGETANSSFGFSVSLSTDGSIIAIGAPYNFNNGIRSGHVRVYKNIAGVWTQVGADIEGEASDDISGFSVSLSADGNIVAIGAYGNDGNGNDSGHVRVYETSTLSVESFNLQDFAIYPNPVIDILKVNSKTNFESVVVYNINGIKFKSINLRTPSLEHQLDVKNLSSGVYFIELHSDKSKQVKKFIKK